MDETLSRIRIHYKKTDPLRYTSNLDLHKIWERLLRRAEIPIAYSQGFHPQPRINQALPLPLGFTSRCEIVDIWLNQNVQIAEIDRKLSVTIQPGIEIFQIENINLSEKKIQNRVIAAKYLALLLDRIPFQEIHSRVQEFISTRILIREKRGKKYDLRPLVKEIEVIYEEKEGRNRIYMDLQTLPGATGRPDEVLSAIHLDPSSAKIERLKILLSE